MARIASKAMAVISLVMGILHPSVLLIFTPFMLAVGAFSVGAATTGKQEGEAMLMFLSVLFVIVLLLAPCGLVLGIISRIRLAQAQQKTSMATAGTVLGIINVLILTMFVSLFFVFATKISNGPKPQQQVAHFGL